MSVRIHLDATHCATKGGRSGIPRMVRELARALRDAGAGVAPVVWDAAAGAFLRPHAFHRRNLDPVPRRQGRRARAVVPLRQTVWNALTRPFRGGAEKEFAGGWAVLAETFPDGRAEWAGRHERGKGPFRLAGIFHDAIGHTHPEWIPAQNRQRFSAYLASLSRCDLVVCISRQSQGDLERFWSEQGLPPAPTRVLHWPASGVVARRQIGTDCPVPGPFLLCVASLEPRKNHLALLRACRALWEEGLRFTLVLAGQRLRSGSEEIFAEIEALRGAGFPVVWEGEIDDLLLAALYRDCLFTVYPSLKEGFGLPILESLGFGKACVCHREGAIAEAAEGGGCLQADVADPAALAGAIRKLVEDPAELRRLEAEAAARPLRTWADWAGDFLSLLKEAEKA